MEAPRRLLHALVGSVRGGRLALALVAGVAGAPGGAESASVCTNGDGRYVEKACFTDVAGAPQYGHDVLGDTPEWDALTIFWGVAARTGRRGAQSTLTVPDHVFEDIAPRVLDLDQDGVPEILVVQSSFSKGAQIAVYGMRDGVFGQLAVNPHIGTRNRWLAPVGAADLDGDGHVEIAYVDRPHLARTLRVWRYRNHRLEPVADLQGLTNHRIGENFITGGIRVCDQGVEMITADTTWRNIMATRLQDGALSSVVIGAFGLRAVDDALACR